MITLTEAKVRDFETTRLKSTAGAGVGSLLMDEATILNPAPIGFFNMGSLYVQKGSGDFTGANEKTPFSNYETDDLGFVISDAKGSLKGSVSYLKTQEDLSTRKRMSVALAGPVGQYSSMGVSYRFTTDKESPSSNEEKINQVIFGVSHALNESFTLGVVIIDPMKKRPTDTKGILGAQYVYKDFISLMYDMGADYNRPLDETMLYRAAVQFKMFEDFYLRAGVSKDKFLEEKSTGAGLGWIQPRLVVDIALKNTTISENTIKQVLGKKLKETSFSLSYKF